MDQVQKFLPILVALALISFMLQLFEIYILKELFGSKDLPIRNSPGNIVLDKVTESSNRFLHILITRFNQFQPSLSSLNEARLQLFETFCFPSVKAQLSEYFFWLVYLDPETEPALLERLENLRHQFGSHRMYLVKTNSDALTHEMIQARNIASLPLELIKQLDDAGTSYEVLIMSRLDCDDALSQYFFLMVQERALAMLETPNQFFLRVCAQSAINWVQTISHRSGITEFDRLPNGECLSTGLSDIVLRSEKPIHASHVDKISGGCTHPMNVSLNSIEYQRYKKNLHQRLPPPVYCTQDISSEHLHMTGLPAALRPRTITSTGMRDYDLWRFRHGYPWWNLHLLFNFLRGVVWESLDRQSVGKGKLCDKLVQHFSVKIESVTQANAYLNTHVDAIAQDGLFGMCQRGHSCKESTKKKFHQFLNY
mmetsp:Transcript_4854/g.6388  ORF Transcript_4854/g.6388 Transcript_4854/m.6388 type:complete len:425 (-) Transcript_4854:232-1506(-)